MPRKNPFQREIAAIPLLRAHIGIEEAKIATNIAVRIQRSLFLPVRGVHTVDAICAILGTNATPEHNKN